MQGRLRQLVGRGQCGDKGENLTGDHKQEQDCFGDDTRSMMSPRSWNLASATVPTKWQRPSRRGWPPRVAGHDADQRRAACRATISPTCCDRQLR